MAGAFVVNAARQVTGSKRFLSRRAASRVSKTNVAARAEAKEPAKETTFFAGDIGGTNARLQVWQVDASGGSTLTFEKTYSTTTTPRSRAASRTCTKTPRCARRMSPRRASPSPGLWRTTGAR